MRQTSINAQKRRNSVERNWPFAMHLRYFEGNIILELIQEFKQELKLTDASYMYRFRPDYEMRARQSMNIRENADRQKTININDTKQSGLCQIAW
jgi:urocanate hydratase